MGVSTLRTLELEDDLLVHLGKTLLDVLREGTIPLGLSLHSPLALC